MPSGSRKIREERMTAYEGMKAIMEKINRGDRLSVEERADFDARNRRISELETDLRTAEEAERLAEEMRKDSDGATRAPSPIDPREAREREFTQYLRTGYIGNEVRAMGEGTLAPAGAPGSTPGYLVPPGWFQRLQTALKVYGGIARDFELLETASGQSLQWATVDPTTTVAQLVGSSTTTGANGQTPGQGSGGGTANENQAVGDLDYVFGQGTLSAYMYTSGVQKVSIQLANDAAFNIDGFVSARVAESIGRGQAAAAVNGTGSSMPLGIYRALSGWLSSSASNGSAVGGTTNSNGGVVTLVSKAADTSIDMGNGATTQVDANTLAIPTLRAMIATVDPAYRALGAKFYMNDAQLLGLRALVDSNGRPLVNLQDGVTPGVPTSVWGYEIVVDNNIPNLSTSGVVGGGSAGIGGPVFGHLQSAMILRTVTEAGLMRLDQRYMDQLQIGYIGYVRFDMKSNDLRSACTVKAIA